MSEQTTPGGSRRVIAAALTLALYALLLDGLVEAWVFDSSIKWLTTIVTLAYGGASYLAWKRITWDLRAGLSVLVLLLLLALSAHTVGSVSAEGGYSLLAASTSSVALAICLLALALSALALLRLEVIPRGARIAIGVLLVYAAVPFAVGLVRGIPFDGVFRGEGYWEWPPFWLQGAWIGVNILLPLAFFVVAGVLVADLYRRRFGQLRQRLFEGLCLLLAFQIADPSLGRPVLRQPQALPEEYAVGEVVGGDFDVRLANISTASRAKALEGDLDRIFRFVADHVRFESYPGVLRGARGALLGRAGNSYDQSLLLAQMLNEAGFQTRFVSGELKRKDAEELIETLFYTESPLPAEDLDRNTGMWIDREILEDFVERTLRDFELVEDALNDAGVEIDGELFLSHDELIREAQEHVWVQAKQGETWVDLDPCFAGAAPGTTRGTDPDVWEAIPQDRYHRVTIRVRVEQRDGSDLQESHPLAFEATTAELAGQELMLYHEVETGTGGAFLVASGIEQFTPVLLISDRPVRGSAITWQGSKGLGALIAGEGGEGSQVTGEWIEFEMRDPDGGVEMIERQIFDRIGFAARQSGGATAPLAPMDEKWFEPFFFLAVTTGFIPGDLLNDFPRRLEGTDYLPGLNLVGGYLTHGYRWLRDVLSWHAFDPGPPSYLAAPNLTIAEFLNASDSDDDPAFWIRLDLTHKAVRTVAPEASRPLGMARVFEGVLDANVERALSQQMALGAKEFEEIYELSVGAIFEAAEDQDVEWLALDSSNIEKLEALSLPEDGRARIRKALEAGHAVVTPSGPVTIASIPTLGWWQIDPRTGATLDELEGGLHATKEEYLNQNAQSMKKAPAARKFGCKMARAVMVMLIVVFTIVPTAAIPGLWGVSQKGICMDYKPPPPKVLSSGTPRFSIPRNARPPSTRSGSIWRQRGRTHIR